MRVHSMQRTYSRDQNANVVRRATLNELSVGIADSNCARNLQKKDDRHKYRPTIKRAYSCTPCLKNWTEKFGNN